MSITPQSYVATPLPPNMGPGLGLLSGRGGGIGPRTPTLPIGDPGLEPSVWGKRLAIVLPQWGPRAGTTVWGRGRNGTQGWDYCLGEGERWEPGLGLL